MLLSSFFPGCKSLFSRDMTKARVSQHESIELTDMGSKSSSGEDDIIAESVFRKAVEDTSLRYGIENILSSHGISFEEVAFEMGDGSCNQNRVPVPYVRVKGITSPVPHLTWFEAEGQIAEALLKRDLGIFRIDMKPAMLARSVEPGRRVKKRSSASDLAWFRLF